MRSRHTWTRVCLNYSQLGHEVQWASQKEWGTHPSCPAMLNSLWNKDVEESLGMRVFELLSPRSPGAGSASLYDFWQPRSTLKPRRHRKSVRHCREQVPDKLERAQNYSRHAHSVKNFIPTLMVHLKNNWGGAVKFLNCTNSQITTMINQVIHQESKRPARARLGGAEGKGESGEELGTLVVEW